ncbi:MAG: arylsulfatase [Proteobacteria bacterium]|jgi:arylsulfatase A-like enzyme|nr:arylsulfatase [Pseudomonadota bacterium]
MRKNYINWVLFCTSIAFLSACGSEAPDELASTEAPATEKSRPNILLIVADDLGYTDLGVYGGEIDTRNLDQLAIDGLLLTDFHNQAVCAPTRAAILSGTDNHNAGGAMHQAPNQRDMPGYESYLNEDIVAFPALLQQGGYNTYWAGKWHLGRQPHQTPDARGFTRSFGLMEGGASHYADARGNRALGRPLAHYVENGVPVERLPEDFYSSDFYTDYIIDSIDAGMKSGDPWFAFLAFTAPHWPLQAPDEYIAKYKGVYDDGYEVLRANRIARARDLGVIPREAEVYPRLEIVAPWNSLSDEEKAMSAKKMEIYAGMVDSLDKNVGRLIEHLKAIGEYDNTFIMFIADNGAEGEDRENFIDLTGVEDIENHWTYDNSLENIGRPGSYVSYGPAWAQAGVGVMRYFKSRSSEGGTRGPAFIHHPDLSKKGEINNAFASVVDLAPTFLELAGVTHPERGFNGRPLMPLQGESLVPLVFGGADTVRREDFTFGWEVFGHRALRKGDWKLLWLTSVSPDANQLHHPTERADHWGLYNLAVDPGETNDLSVEEPEKLVELLVAWEEYVATNGIILPDMSL